MPSSKQIFPPEILNFTIEREIVKHSTRSQVIYCTILLALLASLASLPFIKTDVSIKSQGIIRPATSISVVSAPVSGEIKSINIKENEMVKQGDPLITIASDLLEDNRSFYEKKVELTASYISDLQTLLKDFSDSPYRKSTNLNTAYYQQQHRAFKEKVNEINTRYLKHSSDHKRQKLLFESQAISQIEYEQSKYTLDKIRAEMKVLHQSQLTSWQTELKNAKTELQQLKTKLIELSNQKDKYTIKAPVSGTIHNMTGLYKGNFIHANQELLQISPDTNLIAEVYISPKDIGLLKENNQAKFQVDAFNYNQWGVVTGHIKEISSDVIMQNNQPVFKVTCSLDQHHLVLKEKYTGNLKKGMTLKARFIITERSLWNLLYDKVDDWINPQMG